MLHKRRGFTLLELLVVIAIIGILATVGLVTYGTAQKSARDVSRKQNLHAIQLALEQYYAANGSYPLSGGTWRGEPSAYGGYKTDYIPGLVPTYMRALPNDPRSGQSYPPCNNGSITGYLYYSDGVNYKVMAYCTPEGAMGTVSNNPYLDPVRPTYSWQVSSGDVTSVW